MFKLYFIALIIFANSLAAKEFIIDNLTNPGITSQGQRWSFITDGVMGGLSEGKATITSNNEVPCYRMSGYVRTENNGGFIQIRTAVYPNIKAKNFDGIYINAIGNNEKYSLHIRTSASLGYWQYYSTSFFLESKFNKIKIPFDDFIKSNVNQPDYMYEQNIKSIGLVASSDDFFADICLSEIGFY